MYHTYNKYTCLEEIKFEKKLKSLFFTIKIELKRFAVELVFEKILGHIDSSCNFYKINDSINSASFIENGLELHLDLFISENQIFTKEIYYF